MIRDVKIKHPLLWRTIKKAKIIRKYKKINKKNMSNYKNTDKERCRKAALMKLVIAKNGSYISLKQLYYKLLAIRNYLSKLLEVSKNRNKNKSIKILD